MAEIPLATFFAPAERADREVLRAQNQKLASLGLVKVLLDTFPEGAVVLNAQRQIVHANDKVAAFLAMPGETLVGLRMGEALDCIHSHEPPAGCGTTQACRHCGAAQAMETSRLNQSREVQECRILRTGQAPCPALDLRVWATQLELDGERFTILALRDISDEKRREVLERIFFHDVMNLAGGLRGVLQQLPELSGRDAIEFEHLAAFQAEQLVEEIECQRDLTAAERGELAVHRKPVLLRELLDRICFLYRHHPVGEGKSLIVEAASPDATLTTDPILLRRVLGNLIKNALEASPPGATVTVRCAPGTDRQVFSVHNHAVLDDAVRAQIFQRSFSTKGGTGRGLGSYSVKLLTERYLQGTVDFDSREGAGTTFRIMLPMRAGEAEVPSVARPPSAGAEVTSRSGERSLVGMRILLADDNRVNQHLVKGLLRNQGLEVQVVSNGREAVEAVQAQSYDALLMDAEMPEMDGFAAAAEIRARERHSGGHMPIIALTAHSSPEDRQRCLSCGMDEHLTKPLAIERVLDSLRRLCQVRS